MQVSPSINALLKTSSANGYSQCPDGGCMDQDHVSTNQGPAALGESAQAAGALPYMGEHSTHLCPGQGPRRY